MKKENRRAIYTSYALGLVITGVFFAFVFAVLFLFAPRQASFLYLMIYFLLPLSPFFVVWLYFLYKALVPVTGGMPGKGFKQWFYGYLFGLSILLYLISVAIALDLLLPTFDRDYTEMIFPSVITVMTLFVLLRIPRVNRFMWKVWGTEEERKEHEAKQAEPQQSV